MATNTPHVVLRDASRKTWLEFVSPIRVLTARRIDEVMPLLYQIEEAVENDGLYAAGFLSYEAAPAFDPALPVRDDDTGFPLLWFGLFENFNEIDELTGGGESIPSASWEKSITQDEYRRCLGEIHDFIGSGDTYQVNFTYRLRALTDIDPWRLFVGMAGGGEAPYAAFVDTGEWAVCSASPELFLRLDGKRIGSRPMKGTSARGLWFEQDQELKERLESSVKDRAENLMIVDMVRNDLGRVAIPGSVEVPALFEIEKYPGVWQMTSTVCARTREPMARILQATFPPASITGAPKRRTMEIIAQLECSPRRIYTGTIGYMSPRRRAQFNVAIRTVLVNHASGHAEFGVGGGIVWDSQPASEYAECRTKSHALRPVAHDFDLLETLLWTPGGGYALLEYHLTRITRSADYFGFRLDTATIRRKLTEFAGDMSSGPRRVRLLVTRGGAIRFEASPLDDASISFGDITLAKDPIDAANLFLYHKTTRRDVYEDALKSSPGCHDVLLFNEAGEITESTIANVAVDIDGTLCTPPVSCGLLPGTQRACLLEQGRIREKVITIAEALASPHIYLMNSVRGMLPTSGAWAARPILLT